MLTEPAPGVPSGELRGLTGLRIVAATWVVLFHFHFTPLPGVAAVVDVLGPLITSGALGVDLFFVLSGFVIAHTYLDVLGPAFRAGATARFVWARACRLWPVHLLVLHVFGLWLVARLVLGSDNDIAFQRVQPVVDAGQYVQQLLLVQLWDDPSFDGASWVGPAWSISAEWLAYLLFPLAALAFFRLRRLPAAVLGLAALALMAPMAWAYLSTGSPYYPWSWLVRILCGFGGGVLAQLAVRRLGGAGGVHPDRVRRAASVLVAALPVLIVAGLLLGESAGPRRGGAVIVAFPLLVGALALADRGPARLLSSRWAVHGGRSSYCLYLVHIPMFEVYWLSLRRFEALGPDTWLAPAVGVAVVCSTFVVAALVSRLFEEPVRRRLRGLGRTGSAPGPNRADADRPDAPAPPVPADPRTGRHAASGTRRATLVAVLAGVAGHRPAHRAPVHHGSLRRARVVPAGP